MRMVLVVNQKQVTNTHALPPFLVSSVECAPGYDRAGDLSTVHYVCVVLVKQILTVLIKV